MMVEDDRWSCPECPTTILASPGMERPDRRLWLAAHRDAHRCRQATVPARRSRDSV